MKSQNVGCCGARSWTLVIGWFQAVTCGIFAGFGTLCLLFFAYVQNNKEDFPDYFGPSDLAQNITSDGDGIFDGGINSNENFALVVSCWIFMILVFIVGTVMGTMLITGVNERNACKLKAWLILEAVYICVIAFCLITRSVNTEVDCYNWIQNALAIAIGLFCLWVVNVHRQELLGFSGGEMNPGFNYQKNQI